MSVTRPIIAILGSGSMGSSILEGLVADASFTDTVRVTTRSAASAAKDWPAVVTAASLEADPEANRRAVAGADIVMLGAKPTMIGDLLAEVADSLEPGAVVVSIAAGVTTATMERLAPAGTAVVRAMPNTPTAIGLGTTALAAGSSVSYEQFALVTAMFEAVGAVVPLPEERMDAVTAVSGSGPAYVYFIIESFTRAAEALGFTGEEALRLVAQTFQGATALLDESGKAPEQLRREVTSPGGTTAAAIAVMEESGMAEAIAEALAAAQARSKEISEGR